MVTVEEDNLEWNKDLKHYEWNNFSVSKHSLAEIEHSLREQGFRELEDEDNYFLALRLDGEIEEDREVLIEATYSLTDDKWELYMNGEEIDSDMKMLEMHWSLTKYGGSQYRDDLEVDSLLEILDAHRNAEKTLLYGSV